MKLLSIILNALIIISCQNNSNNAAKKEPGDTVTIIKIDCNENYDSLLLEYAKDFRADEIGLDKNLTEEVSAFILRTGTLCLEKQKEYNTFVVTVLAKLYLHHLQCCNQGYDLLSMRSGAASVIIDGFRKLAGYKDRNLEMLNSGTVVDFIDKEPAIKANNEIQEIRRNIEKEAKRIEKGI